MLLAVALIVVVLAVTRTDYRTYFDGAQFVHFLLGPAVVALAVPLARQWHSVRRLAVPIAGALVAVASAVGIAWALLLAAAHDAGHSVKGQVIRSACD